MVSPSRQVYPSCQPLSDSSPRNLFPSNVLPGLPIQFKIPNLFKAWVLPLSNAGQRTSDTPEGTRSRKPAHPHPSVPFKISPRKRLRVKQLNLDQKPPKVNRSPRGTAKGWLFRSKRTIRRHPSRHRRRHRHQVEDRGQLNELDLALERVIDRNNFDTNDEILLRQMSALNMDRAFRTELFTARETMRRADLETPKRVSHNKRRDAVVERWWREEETRMMLAAERNKREDQRRLLEEEERRLQLAREAKEEQERARARHAEEVRLERFRIQEVLKKLYEAKVEMARQERERREREAAARLQEELRKKEEAIRREALRQAETARCAMEQARVAAEFRRQFEVYDAKWALLKSRGELYPVTSAELPWPILHHKGSETQSPEQRVREFVFHPLRPNMDGKTKRERLMMELLKWHTDKFNAIVLPKVVESERQVAQHDAGEVNKILSLLKEEVNMD